MKSRIIRNIVRFPIGWINLLDAKLLKEYHELKFDSHKIVLYFAPDFLLKNRFISETRNAFALISAFYKTDDFIKKVRLFGYGPSPFYVAFYGRVGLGRSDFGLVVKSCEEFGLPLTEFYACQIVEALWRDKFESAQYARNLDIPSLVARETSRFAASTGPYAAILTSIANYRDKEPAKRSVMKVLKETLEFADTEHVRERERKLKNN